MIQRQVYQSRLVERLIARMDEIPDGDGTTLLDNTVVLYVSEPAHGAHGLSYWPALMFGGSGTGAIRPGRYIKYAQDLPSPWNVNPGGGHFYDDNQFSGPPHSRLYLSALRALGVDIPHLMRPPSTAR